MLASAADFPVLGKLGEGAYGRVLLVRQTGSRSVYAMKVLSKSNMLKSERSRRLVEQAITEKEILFGVAT